jgi:hypothetical protein
MTDQHRPDETTRVSRPSTDALAELGRLGADAIARRSGNGASPAQASTERRYLPTLADLIDRMTICQLKAIHIPEHAEDYRQEIDLILHDVDSILKRYALDAEAVRAIAVLMLTNHFIWINESKARAGGSEQDHLLRVTHSINGVRATAKNVIASKSGGRKDYKIDAFAADLPAEFANWNIFGQR